MYGFLRSAGRSTTPYGRSRRQARKTRTKTTFKLKINETGSLLTTVYTLGAYVQRMDMRCVRTRVS